MDRRNELLTKIYKYDFLDNDHKLAIFWSEVYGLLKANREDLIATPILECVAFWIDGDY